MAGHDFVSGFLKRHPRLSLRKPESVSINRVFGLNKTSVNLYFNNLKTVLNKHNFKEHEIFNCDESGLTCVHKPVKVLTPKGKRCVLSATSGERGQTTTIVTACSGSGVYVPPMMIFKRKRNKPELVDHAPAGTIGRCSANGWIDSDLFLEYLKHFVAYTKCSKGSPVLLILDGHKTHTKNMTTIEYARDNGVVILSLPPHTSHKLQPLDRSFFKPLKSAFNAACSTWLRKHPGRRITIDKLGELFNTAYLKAAGTLENAVSGFKCTGIIPFNPEMLPSSEFMDDPREAELASPSDESLHSPAGSATQRTIHDETISTETPSTESSSVIEPAAPVLPVPASTESCNLPPVPEEGEPSSLNVSFSDILKLPSITEKKKSKQSEESEIIASSPYKQSLLDNLIEQSNKRKQKLPANPKKAKKAKVKAKKSKKPDAESVDAQCPMCDGFWSESLPGEDWVECSECKKWFHEECCSSVTPSSATCDICS